MEYTPIICDTCGQKITAASEGWVEWLMNRQKTSPEGFGIRIVHHNAKSGGDHGCQYNEHVEFERSGATLNDLPLSFFTTSDGLMLLLSFIGREVLPKEEVIEIIKRLHIPGYERVRSHLEEAISHEIYEPATPPGYPTTSDIERVIEWLDGN